MDFYGILFDMKNGKKIPYSKNYFDTMFAAKLEELGVKTITGTLPLTFTTSETALRSWTIYGNNYEHKYSTSGALPLTFTTHTAGNADDWSISGNDNVGKNLLEITAETQTRDGITFTVNKQAGMVTLNGVTSAGFSFAVAERTDLDGTYLLSGCADGGSSTSYDLYMYDVAEQRFSERCYDSDDVITFNCVAGHVTRIYIQCRRNYNYDNVVFRPMLRLPDTSADFEPYQIGIGEKTENGYQIPITVLQTNQTDKTININIGDSPLTEGETVSKTSTGVDLELFEGENTVSTTLYNKPETSITYRDYLGVGEYVNGQWQIPLSVTCDRNLFNIRGNMAGSGGIQPIDFNAETSSVTGEMSADSHYILGYANAIVKGDETFVISFDKTTAGTAELRMMNGTGSSAEIIETFDISAAKSYRVVFECEESFGDVYPWLVATEAATNTFEHIMIKKASDKGGFVPYGAHTDYTIPIDAPLTEGQSVSDTVEITAYEGTNTIDTTMANKPEMSITYKGG